LINQFKSYIDVSDNTISDFLQNLKEKDYIEDHFEPQTSNMEKFIFDHVIEINNMKLLYNI